MEKPAIGGGKPVRNKEEFLVFGQPEIKEEEINEVLNTLRSKWIGTGPKTLKFEKLFSEYIDPSNQTYAVALSSCTAALHLSLKSLGIKEGDEVITTPFSFVATSNAIIHVGAKPVFVDIEKDTFNINVDDIEEKITDKTKVILPVHFTGRPCEMDNILDIANTYNLKIVEDAAHAIETKYKNKKIGTIGDITCFSFYATKNLTTAEGGMITTQNKNLADKIKTLSLHGLSADAWSRYSDKGYEHYLAIDHGFKYNMTDLNASLGIHQLSRINENLKKRERIWNLYDDAFKDLPLILVKEEKPENLHSRHLYKLILELEELKINRDQVLDALHAENIGCGVHYIPIHLHPFYSDNYHYKRGDFPNAEFIGDRTVSIPLSPALTDKDVHDVINAVTKILTYYRK
jgi:dTDP-4-amino-4,6-dideoxygalactose transaminase